MSTTSRGYRYPAGTTNVPPDVRGDIQNLATDLNTDVGNVSSAANHGGTDTGWSLSAISLLSGWDTKTDPQGNTSGTLVGGARKVGSMVELRFRVNRNGGTISPSSGGNLGDNPVATITSTYRPSGVTYASFYVPGVAQGSFRIETGGNLVITDMYPGASIPNNTVLQLDATYYLS